MRKLIFVLAAMLASCGDDSASIPDAPSPDAATPDASMTAQVPQTSHALGLTHDDASLWVTNPDSDSISVIDTATRTLRQEILLEGQRPAQDPTTHRYDPVAKPRALTLDEPKGKVYVAGQMSSKVYVVDLHAMSVLRSIPVGAEPIAIVASTDGSTIYVVSHQAATVTKIDAASDTVTATLPIGNFPWGASISADGGSLFVTHFLTDPGVTVIDTHSFSVRTVTALPDEPQDSGMNKLVPNGKVRGAYTVVPRPTTGELWVPHLLLAVLTPQPALDFQSTVFPTVSRLAPTGASVTSRILFKPLTVPGAGGNFTDSCSGPRDVAFTPDGSLALVALAQSEDVMVFDGTTGNEVDLVRPLPSAFLEGIVVDGAGAKAYVLGRNTHNVTVLALNASAGRKAQIDGAPIDTLMMDPMPANLRLGQRLFYTANSAAYPITQNFWVACSSCHLEGRTDAVTWLFEQGPRDTPSNAGGPINTGFLFRQATRNNVTDYWKTIEVEQGGVFEASNPAQLPLLQALADFVNYAIPFPPNPNLAADGTLTPSQQRGHDLFIANCTNCHTGAFLTDSGANNPTLDMSGQIRLHDIGTCVTTGPHPDQPTTDIAGNARTACNFDTPSLRGVFATPPYFHDGSAATLEDAVNRVPNTDGFTAAQKADLVEYLKTL
jgi:YVTN family beta-propeller protein